jgi:poly-beta-1,6-N-acetyl-D-glucosamine synthase
VLPEVANDLELPMRIGAAGYWVLHEPTAGVFEKETSSPQEEFARRRRICGQGLLAMWKFRGTLRGLRGWQFVSRKFLRWLTLIPLVLLLICSAVLAGQPFFALVLTLELLFYILAMVGWALALKGRKTGQAFSVPFFVMLGSVAAFVGVVATCLGRRFAVWEVPTLSRGRQERM